ncbi:MAG: hypothetical protein ACI81R_000385 [Bradymonadia bacterium]|jgi:hypothetical protein
MQDDNIAHEIEEADPFHSPAKTIAAVMIALAVLVAVAVGGWTFMARAAIANEDATVAHCPVFADETGVDWAAVHVEHWPSIWKGWEDRPPARAALLGALQGDVQALELATSLLDARPPLPLEESLGEERITALLDAQRDAMNAWNAHMSSRRIPWRLRSPLSSRLRRGYAIAMSDCVMYSGMVRVNGEHDVEVLALSRADGLNVVENYSGVSLPVDSEVHVLLDRIERDALDRVWPAMANPDADSPDYLHVLYSGLDEALRGGLSPRSYDVLRETAEARRALMRFEERSSERRACGGGMLVAEIPMRGFDDVRMASFREIAVPEHRGGCPSLTIEDVDAVRAAGVALRRARGLRPAIDELIGYIVRSSSLGGALYAVDASAYQAETCTECERIGDYTATSLRWMLIDLANAESAELELLSRCAQLERGGRGREARALRYASQQWGAFPCFEPGLTLAEGGRTLEAALFGSATTVEWTELMPDSLRARTR